MPGFDCRPLAHSGHQAGFAFGLQWGFVLFKVFHQDAQRGARIATGQLGGHRANQESMRPKGLDFEAHATQHRELFGQQPGSCGR